MKRRTALLTRMTKDPLVSVSVLSLLAVVLSLTVVFSLSHAQNGLEGQSLEVSPPTQELTANPGETLTVKAKIRNRTSEPKPISVRIEDFVANGDEGQVSLTEKGPWAISTWTTVTPTEFTLAPNEQKEVTATITIPKTGVAGGKYGSFVFAVKGKSSAKAASVTQEVASLFLIDVGGEKIEKLSVTSFTAPSFLEFGPVPMEITYKNDGNIHMKPYGVVSVTDMLGRKVADVTVVGTNVFPQASRKVTVRLEKTLLVGPFTATAILYPGGTVNSPMTATATFTVFPVRIAVVIALVLVVIYLLRKRLLKALKALAGK